MLSWRRSAHTCPSGHLGWDSFAKRSESLCAHLPAHTAGKTVTLGVVPECSCGCAGWALSVVGFPFLLEQVRPAPLGRRGSWGPTSPASQLALHYLFSSLVLPSVSLCPHSRTSVFRLHPPGDPWIFEVTHISRKSRRNEHSIKYNLDILFYQSRLIINQRDRCRPNHIHETGTWQRPRLGTLSSQVYARSDGNSFPEMT